MTSLMDAIGFGIILPVLPGLIMEISGEGLSQAAQYGGWLMFVYAVMQFLFAQVLIHKLPMRILICFQFLAGLLNSVFRNYQLLV